MLSVKTEKPGQLDSRYERLISILKEMGSVFVAFSGGVDSTFLLKAAVEALGKENVTALTATSPTYLESELDEAKRFASGLGVRHIVTDSNELLIPGFAENPVDRCYHCKTELFGICKAKATELGIKHVLDGTNLDDMRDYRPGKKAAEEKEVRHPLLEAELTKADIRELSRRLGLPTWDKPNLACLSSRFPYGTKITEDRLDMIKTAEEHLKRMGFKQLRVRYHGDTARIEISNDELEMAAREDIRKSIVKRFNEIGFTYVTLDLAGYRTGAMNEALTGKKSFD